MTVRIYDPNNVPFDVTEARAADLVLNKGWTRQPTTTVPVEPPANEPPVVDDWRLNPVARQADFDPDYVPEDGEPGAPYEPAEPFVEDEAEVTETPRTSRRRKK